MESRGISFGFILHSFVQKIRQSHLNIHNVNCICQEVFCVLCLCTCVCISVLKFEIMQVQSLLAKHSFYVFALMDRCISVYQAYI